MRILVITNLYPPVVYGGYELSCRDVAERFAARGHDVAVLTSDRAGGTVHRTAGRPRVVVERLLPMAAADAPVPPLLRRPIAEWRAGQILEAVVARHRPEVISVWNPSGLPGGLVGRITRLGRPVVWVLADAWPDRVARGDPWLAPWLRHPIFGRAVSALTGLATRVPDIAASGTVCYCSRDLRDRVSRAMGWPADGAVITPLGVDLSDFPLRATPERAQWGWRLVYVGRLDPAKGIDTLLRALPLLPSATTLRVVAPPEATHVDRVRALVGELGLDSQVSMSSAGRAELGPIYAAADVCVFPSEWPEPFGLVPLEAMACGTPVAATGTGGSGEYLADGSNCVLFQPGHAGSLADAIRRLSADAELRETVVSGGRAAAASLTVDRFADQLEAVHREALLG